MLPIRAALISDHAHAGVIGAGSGMMTGEVKQNNNDDPVPLNAYVVILLYDVPIYEAVWKTTGALSKYSIDGQTPWWDDESLIKNRGNR